MDKKARQEASRLGALRASERRAEEQREASAEHELMIMRTYELGDGAAGDVLRYLLEKVRP